jgi:hypothetical protein
LGCGYVEQEIPEEERADQKNDCPNQDRYGHPSPTYRPGDKVTFHRDAALIETILRINRLIPLSQL